MPPSTANLQKDRHRLNQNIIERLATFPIDSCDLQFRDEEALRDYLYTLGETEVARIGFSRDAQELYGLRIGHGKIHASVIAGCHADEPVGPMTAQILPTIIPQHFPQLCDAFRISIVPQMNPDGADRNRDWFASPPDLADYLEQVRRELPGDDLEFGFGEGKAVRPECTAAQAFLKAHTPFAAHLSLHGMAFAEGAWCLICKEWAERGDAYMKAFDSLCARMNFPQHDIDRGGEKGFTRIRDGYCTTPTSSAMKEHFIALNDRGLARRFLPTSMEWAQSHGGDPLCIVSELPLFLIGQRSPSLEEPVKKNLRNDLDKLRADSPRIEADALQKIEADYQLTSVPLELQVRLQVSMIVLALYTILDQAIQGPHGEIGKADPVE
jgi:hypothetical protein